MNQYQQQALLSLIQQMKSSLEGIERLILMAEGPDILTSSVGKKAKNPAADLGDDEEDALDKIFAEERKKAEMIDSTLKDIWSTANDRGNSEG